MTPEARDAWAKERLFNILIDGEVYERRLTENGSLFMVRDDERGTWYVEYLSGYHDNKGKWNGKHAVKADGVKWEKAMSEAENFIRWFAKPKGGQKGGRKPGN